MGQGKVILIAHWPDHCLSLVCGILGLWKLQRGNSMSILSEWQDLSWNPVPPSLTWSSCFTALPCRDLSQHPILQGALLDHSGPRPCALLWQGLNTYWYFRHALWSQADFEFESSFCHLLLSSWVHFTSSLSLSFLTCKMGYKSPSHEVDVKFWVRSAWCGCGVSLHAPAVYGPPPPPHAT